MGVHGLWKLIKPSGQMVPLESLAGKVLAVDVSIWLHQAVKGMHDAHGAPLAVAHLLILFHRICKLLFFKIKPVFVFDGGVPALKQQTMAARRQRSSMAKSESIKVREKLIKNILKHEAVRHLLSDKTALSALGLNSFTLPGPSVEEDLYKLPPIAADYDDSESSEDISENDEESEKLTEDIYSIDVTSQEFLALPTEIRHDILTDLIETRKQSSWKYLDSMPKKSDNFSDFQMNRLLKRYAVQTSLEKAGKEMGGRALSLKELESLLGDQGVLDPKVDLPSKRIAQDNVTHYMLVQKNSKNLPEPEKEKKFDIMNHLEDVDWSSESDTDVILQRPRERQKRLNKTDVLLNTECVVEGNGNKTQESENESCLISKQPKVRITQEVADILSILEDKDATMDVKVKIKNLQTKINYKEKLTDLKASQSETKTPGGNSDNINVVMDSVGLKESVKPLYTENRLTNLATALDLSESITEAHDEEVKKKKTFENTICVEKAMRNDLSLGQTSPKIPFSVDTTEVTKESSSDSEIDFVPVANEGLEIVSGNSVEKKSDEPSEASAPKSHSLVVVINPLELDQKDDFFADVFKPVSYLTEEANSSERDEIVQNINEFKDQISVGDLNELRKDLNKQCSDLLKEKGKQERLAMNLTDQVYIDAQELLRLFGIPFVVAPLEAEAQCATLNAIGLTEGTITDDSDIWLFGGKVVYKNFFNQQKHVLEYKSENIQKHFKLTREEMIKMALLVGSDYTVGLSGIGPVTALEIIAAFQTSNSNLFESLQKFRDWFMGSGSDGVSRATLRRKIRNTVITPGFPNKSVIEAYLHPLVDNSKEPFSWAKPNSDLIHKYMRAKLGWSSEKCNEFLLPVIKKLEENTSQTTLDKHFKIMHKSKGTEGMLSKRVEHAVKHLGSSLGSDETIDEPKPRKKPRGFNVNNAESSSKDFENAEEVSKTNSRKLQTRRKKESDKYFKTSLPDETLKIKLINEKLHLNVKVPQKEMTQKLLEEKKKEAIKIFRTFKKRGKKKTKVFAKEEANLSESSSEDD